MPLTTTTPKIIIKTELEKPGFCELWNNEFYNANQLTFFDEKYAYEQKILNYDSDVHHIVDGKFFHNLSLSDPEDDKFFKRMWTSYFANKQIAYQTLESFAAQNIAVFMTHKMTLDTIFANWQNYTDGLSTGENKQTNTATNTMRNGFQDLPQDKVNLDLDDDTMEYATNNTLSKDRHTNVTENTNKSNVFNPDNLTKLQPLFRNILNDFKKHAFLLVFR